MTSVAVFRGLVRLYPRRFREEFGEDMVLLFAEQLRDERAVRVWGRGLLDLAITVPAQHLEARMSRPDPKTVTSIYGAIALAGLVVGVVAGTSLGIAGVGLVVAAVAGTAAAVSWRRTRSVGVAPLTDRWWKFLVGGIGVVALIAVATSLTGELPEGAWAPVMVALLAAVLSCAFGVVLGVAHLAVRRRRSAPST